MNKEKVRELINKFWPEDQSRQLCRNSFIALIDEITREKYVESLTEELKKP